MTLLTPLGLLGLLGVVALIIIYIIKPNYQQKMISSTFVWKLSLKYRKKKIPTSRLRDILLILCQILILTCCAAILAKPVEVLKAEVQEEEIIIVLDSSASMRAGKDGETRFKRAVDGVLEKADEVFAKNGLVSVILADDKASFIAQRATLENREEVITELQNLADQNSCSYGRSDIDEAMELSKDILYENEKAKMYIYTDIEYVLPSENIELVNVAEKGEWNAGILNASAVLEENYYNFYIDIACYGANEDVELNVLVNGVNTKDNNDVTDLTLPLSEIITCEYEATERVIFMHTAMYNELTLEDFEQENVHYFELEQGEWVYSYKDIHIELNVEDSYIEDDKFEIFNGQKEVLKVQYASLLPNSFFSGVLSALENNYKNVWDLQISEVKQGETALLEGFDFYIFEHTMPEVLPKDGVVLFVNPDPDYSFMPAGSGIKVDSVYDFRKESVSLTEETTHALLTNITADNITVSKYVRVSYTDPEFETLLTCDTYPILSFKNTNDSKIIAMNFSLHYSNLPILKEFPILMHNIFQYFLPATVSRNSFEVYENVSLKARGTGLEVYYDSLDATSLSFSEFPATMTLDKPGTYYLVQGSFLGKELLPQQIYVKVPAAESNIWEKDVSFADPYITLSENTFYNDLLFYIAAALVALLFIEWWLHSRENM